MHEGTRLSRQAISLLVTCLSFVGCSSATEPEDAAVLDAPLLAAGQNMLWSSGEVPYCFASQGSSPVLEQRKREFREALAQSWSAENVVRFSERSCDSTTVQVSFAQLGSGIAGMAGVGRLGGLQLGLQLSAMYLQTSDPMDFKWVAAHEMGHVLGFLHEQDQRNSTCNQGRDYSGQGVPLTGYDPSSVMNYCAMRNNNSILSALDREGLRRAYGNPSNPKNPAPPPSDPEPPANPPTPPTTPPSDICEPSMDLNPGAGASQGGGASISFHLVNQCPNGLRVFWLDYQGREVPYGTLASGVAADFGTYGNHRFRLRSATTGRFIVDVVLPNNNSSLTMPYR